MISKKELEARRRKALSLIKPSRVSQIISANIGTSDPKVIEKIRQTLQETKKGWEKLHCCKETYKIEHAIDYPDQQVSHEESR